MKGTTTGKADVYVDDALVTTIDLSNPVAVYEQHVWSTGIIEAGLHRVKISRNVLSPAGKYVTLDAVDVLGRLVSAPPTITGLYPGTGSTDGGTSVVISGTNFEGASAVTFDGMPRGRIQRGLEHQDHCHRAGPRRRQGAGAGDYSRWNDRQHGGRRL